MGAGETTITLVAAAIGNAVFDATGARLREVPFTPERVKAALAAAINGRRLMIAGATHVSASAISRSAVIRTAAPAPD